MSWLGFWTVLLVVVAASWTVLVLVVAVLGLGDIRALLAGAPREEAAPDSTDEGSRPSA